MSKKAEERMVRSSLCNNPPAVYHLVEDIIIRRFPSSSKRKSTKDRVTRIVKGTVTKFSPKTFCYKVSYMLDRELREDWFIVQPSVPEFRPMSRACSDLQKLQLMSRNFHDFNKPEVEPLSQEISC